MRKVRNVVTMGALAALAVGASTAFATTASAAPNVTPQGVCGKAYKTVNSAPVGSLGTVYLTYNSANGENCVATIRKNPGTLKPMSTWVYIPATDEYAGDADDYSSYAGPAYVYGKGFCASWGGSIDNVYVSVENSNCGSLKEHRVTEIR
ncbi:spore-associated protein [Streptomyces caniscabiei]|uniref:Spore-associated protein n=1 Tax=Streptomyces caniscabiei TaxID=2746961 RepID=A0A927L979_9ACTN|nr:spore-associated protein [Streptomyces caniscabiei]MBD9726384.1 spore-associated protein [Streptomyces caniscabiei]MDX3511761.1 spore-associated protein [Streptomyces caniscabiei]MDX3719310.1 spore-associated protein [Streptomyces caniscabiei]MDX3726124.1 spore-associated protein [Streptomyces caniscabiei]WEO29551.1 spore-associated protein [Streptomyces caniscabiei]